MAAVKPAVPHCIAMREGKFSGISITQLAGTRMYSDKPPCEFIPISKPVTNTRVPVGNFPERSDTTTPAASIPGMCGKFRVMPLWPLADKASL